MRLLTFTRAATAELAEKVAGSPDAEVERPATIHSFAIASLLANPGSAPFPEPLRIADDWEVDQLIAPQLREIVRVSKGDVKRKLLPEMAAGWESLEPRPRPDVSEEVRSRFLGAFEQQRRVFGYLGPSAANIRFFGSPSTPRATTGTRSASRSASS
jgi:hypothetical protein